MEDDESVGGLPLWQYAFWYIVLLGLVAFGIWASVEVLRAFDAMGGLAH